MYVNSSFRMAPDHVAQLLRDARVGDLVTRTADGLDATYLPLVYDPDAGEFGTFHLHLQRINPQWRTFEGEGLLILHGDTHVIQATYYDGPGHVGTLNYETIHVYGTLVVHDDIAYLRRTVDGVAERMESSWRLADMPAADADKMLRAAVGLELQVTRIEAKAKLSQNKRPDVITTLMNHLEADGNPAAAALLAEHALPVATERQAYIDEVAARHRARG